MIDSEDRYGLHEGVKQVGVRAFSSMAPVWFDARRVGDWCWHAGDEWNGTVVAMGLLPGGRVVVLMKCKMCWRRWHIDSAERKGEA